MAERDPKKPKRGPYEGWRDLEGDEKPFSWPPLREPDETVEPEFEAKDAP